ncbi:ABC transporter substrate-binding protein [Bordetella sp. 2513F-2]
MTRFGRREFLLATAGAAAGGLLPAALRAQPAALDLAELARKAGDEGGLTYYASTNPELSKRLVALFNKTYPDIKVNIVRLATGPLGRRFASEMEAGNAVADILQLGDPLLLAEGHQKGWFADIQDLPAHRAWPAGFKEPYLAVVSLFPHTITYNTNLVKGEDIPRDWQGVLNDKWTGRIIMADVRNSPTLIEWAALMYDTYGADYLKRLASLKPRVVASTLPGTQMVAAGEAAFVLPNLRMVSYSLIEKGAPLDDVTPSPNSGLESMLAISTRSRSPNAARLFANFILTQEGQTVLSKDTAASPMAGVAGALPLPADFHRAKIKEALARAPELLKLLGLT